MSKVFLCYRRDDSGGYAGRIQDWLVRDLGADVMFMDVDDISFGKNFVKTLHEQVAACEVLLAVIGRNWLDARDEDGKRRLENPNDFVRIEIAAALQRDILVVPVLVDGAKIPGANLLPKDLEELSVRNGIDVRLASFSSDIQRLIKALKRELNVDSASTEIQSPKQSQNELSKEAEIKQRAEEEQREAEAVRLQAEHERAEAKRRADEEERRKIKQRAEEEQREAEAVRLQAEHERAEAKRRADEEERRKIKQRAEEEQRRRKADDAGQTERMLAARQEAYEVAMASDDERILKAFLLKYPEGYPAVQVRKRLRDIPVSVQRRKTRNTILLVGFLAVLVFSISWDPIRKLIGAFLH
jgi:flagellar biosynthesis GTPase FlhF